VITDAIAFHREDYACSPAWHWSAPAIVFNHQEMSRNEVMGTGYSSKKYR